MTVYRNNRFIAKVFGAHGSDMPFRGKRRYNTVHTKQLIRWDWVLRK